MEKPYCEQGKLSGIIGVARDIALCGNRRKEEKTDFSELKEAMENIRTLRGMLPKICFMVQEDP